MATVKCLLCSKQFDRDVFEAIKVTKHRYAHKSCVIHPTAEMQKIIDKQKTNGSWIVKEEDNEYEIAQTSLQRLETTNSDLLLNTTEEDVRINKGTGVIRVEPTNNNTDDNIKILQDTIQSIFGNRANWAVCIKQAKSYKNKYGYSYSGMARTLIWYYQKQGNDIKYSKGTLSIVPNNYDKAYNYYRSIWEQQQKNKIELKKNAETVVKAVSIKTPIREPLQERLRKSQFTFLDREEEE